MRLHVCGPVLPIAVYIHYLGSLGLSDHVCAATTPAERVLGAWPAASLLGLSRAAERRPARGRPARANTDAAFQQGAAVVRCVPPPLTFSTQWLTQTSPKGWAPVCSHLTRAGSRAANSPRHDTHCPSHALRRLSCDPPMRTPFGTRPLRLHPGARAIEAGGGLFARRGRGGPKRAAARGLCCEGAAARARLRRAIGVGARAPARQPFRVFWARGDVSA